jgi:hypothetical protein
VVENLVEIIGRKLTAYIGGVKAARAVDRWIAGGAIYGDAESRLRFAFQVARALSEHDSPAVVQAWLTGVNPELGDRVPLRLMRENEIEAVAPDIRSAVRAFLASSWCATANTVASIAPIVIWSLFERSQIIG